MKPGDVVEVEWLDHAVHLGEYDGKAGTVRQRSIGYFVRQDRKVIVLAQSFTEDKPNDSLAIGRRMVLKKRKVR